MAVEIRKQCVAKINNEMELVSYPPIGINWVLRFIQRHPQLQTTLSRAIEISRVNTITKSAMGDFFTKYQEIITKYKILLENIYNIDETGKILLFYNKTYIRICNWPDRKIICRCKQAFAKEISGITRETRMGDIC